MPLTNGEVFFERRIKTGDFEHKHASARIAWSVPEGADNAPAMAHMAFDVAQQETLRILGIDQTAMKVVEPAPVEPAAVLDDAGPALELVGGRPAPARKRAAPKAAEAVSVPVPPSSPAPTAASEQLPPVTPTASPAVAASDEWDAPQLISDDDLNQACNRHYAKIGNRLAILNLIAEYVGGGAKVTAIKQEQRAEFLSRLADVQ